MKLLPVIPSRWNLNVPKIRVGNLHPQPRVSLCVSRLFLQHLLTSCAVRMNLGFPLRIVAPSQMFLRPSPNSCLLSLPELLLFRLCNVDVLPFQQWAWSVSPIAFPPNQFLSVVLFCLAVSSWRWWTRNWSCTNVPLTLLARSLRCPRIVVLRLRSSAPFPVGTLPAKRFAPSRGSRAFSGSPCLSRLPWLFPFRHSG